MTTFVWCNKILELQNVKEILFFIILVQLYKKKEETLLKQKELNKVLSYNSLASVTMHCQEFKNTMKAHSGCVIISQSTPLETISFSDRFNQESGLFCSPWTVDQCVCPTLLSQAPLPHPSAVQGPGLTDVHLFWHTGKKIEGLDMG